MLWRNVLSGSPSSAMRFLTHTEDLYGGTDSPLVSLKFQFRVFRFYSTDGTGGITTCLHKNCSYFFAWVLVHSVLLVMLVAQISTALSIPVPRMWVLHHNFYCVLSGYLPLN
jgi:hypothetical protein